MPFESCQLEQLLQIRPKQGVVLRCWFVLNATPFCRLKEKCTFCHKPSSRSRLSRAPAITNRLKLSLRDPWLHVLYSRYYLLDTGFLAATDVKLTPSPFDRPCYVSFTLAFPVLARTMQKRSYVEELASHQDAYV